MTAMLASVRSPGEAALALRARADIIDLKEPSAGALGALDPATIRAVLRLVDGSRTVSATAGDIEPIPEKLDPAIRRIAETGVDIVKVGVFGALDAPMMALLRRFTAAGVRIVLVFFAETWRGGPEIDLAAAAGISGVMLDTRDKHDGSLLSKLPLARLDEFVEAGRARGLLTGLAGSLRQEDIAVLLPLGPDYLGFRGALCRDGSRGAAIDFEAMLRIRSLLDRGGEAEEVTENGTMAQQEEGRNLHRGGNHRPAER
jgi:uncharacterized protein (UPF0264 family)